MSGNIHIVATGVRTPLGLEAAPVAAAVRAGISALDEHPVLLDCVGEPMPAALDTQLDPFILGPKRFLSMAETALKEACVPLDGVAALPQAVPVFLGLPELRPGFLERDAMIIRSGIAQCEGLPIKLAEVHFFLQGHAAGLVALTKAIEQIQKGAVEVCLVGGVESYLHPDTMVWLDANRQLSNSVSRSGFVPGEAAGFCLVASERACRQGGLKPLAHLRSVALGKETKLIKTEDTCLGEGLTATVKVAVQCLNTPTEIVSDIICDINGERYRGEEWAFVCLRLSQHFADPTDYLSPAECWGDVGAASGPLFITLACQAAARGCTRGARILVWASSEGGRRGAAILETTRE